MTTTQQIHGARPDGGRANALWSGKKKQRFALFAVLMLAASFAALAGTAGAAGSGAYVTPSLLQQATATPDQVFEVVVQAERNGKTDDVVGAVNDTLAEDKSNDAKLKRKFGVIPGVSALMTGKQILKLAKKSKIAAITIDPTVQVQATNTQAWPAAAGIDQLAAGQASTAYPTIAIIDSGVTNLMLGSRFLGNVFMVSASTSTSAYGHGSMVASIAASENAGFAGAEQRAKIISIKVLDGNGVGLKSDVIAACDWIMQNKAAYNIRIANFSINTVGDSILYDPLNWAVEKLWFNGVTVVVAAGNHGTGSSPSNVGFAPANDPFVITVGASDINNSVSRSDDFAAPWSAWGSTQDGFAKPEVAAPGRVMNGSLPSTSTLLALFPARRLSSTAMWMSGTSFSAPVVSGIAASILARNPSWTPDQVKGAIMETATAPGGYPVGRALGVGVVNGGAAAAASGNANPNLGLNQFIRNDSTGTWFDAAGWKSHAASNPTWNAASWSSASWANASWSSASWANASWSSASWANASWANASWANASWANSSDVE